MPRILILHLGRFDNQLNKIDTITPTPLELNCFCTTCLANKNSDERFDHKYRLYGVVVHLGETPNSGHYMTYARTFDEQRSNLQYPCQSNNCCQLKFEPIDTKNENEQIANGFWYNCNDEQIFVISQVEFESRINREGSKNTPYILFYVRNDLLANY